MDVQTMQALLSLLTLMVLVFGGLLGVLWGQLTTIGKALSLHQLHVAENYVTSDEHERRITAEIKSLKDRKSVV